MDRVYSIASLVLPISPGPTRVSNLDSSAISASSSSSRSRPNELRFAGRLPLAVSRFPPIGGTHSADPTHSPGGTPDRFDALEMVFAEVGQLELCLQEVRRQPLHCDTREQDLIGIGRAL